MAASVRLAVRGMEHSAALDTQVNERCAKLEQFYSRIKGIDVAVELEQHNKLHGNPFKVRIVLEVPGPDIVINHQHDEDVYIALRDAFDAATRKLKDLASRVRDESRARPREAAPSSGPDVAE